MTKAAEASRASRTRPPTILPRLLNLQQMADYLGCSYWSARDWVLAGLVPVVELPPLRPREGERLRKTLRRVLVDREDLDRFIESRKRGGERDVRTCAGFFLSCKQRPKSVWCARSVPVLRGRPGWVPRGRIELPRP